MRNPSNISHRKHHSSPNRLDPSDLWQDPVSNSNGFSKYSNGHRADHRQPTIFDRHDEEPPFVSVRIGRRTCAPRISLSTVTCLVVSLLCLNLLATIFSIPRDKLKSSSETSTISPASPVAPPPTNVSSNIGQAAETLPVKSKSVDSPSSSKLSDPVSIPSDPNVIALNHSQIPMNVIKDIRVPGNTGILDAITVKYHYKQLIDYYLMPFKLAGGIQRKQLLDILGRKTEETTPKGAKLATQSIYAQIIDRRLYIVAPNELDFSELNSFDKSVYKSRVNEVITILSKLIRERRIESDTEFIFHVHNCIQTSNHKHYYRAPKYLENKPVFTTATCNFSDNIPFPVWNGNYNPKQFKDEGFLNWDNKMKKYSERVSKLYPFDRKEDMVIFRGKNRPSMFFREEEESNKFCDEIGRPRLLFLQNEEPDLLNISLRGECNKRRYKFEKVSVTDQHRFKLIIHAEGICLWSDRLRYLLFGNSVIVKQTSACGQFFEPLLKEDVHFVSTDFFFNDLVDAVIRAKEDIEFSKKLISNANEFASNFLSLRGIEAYIEVLLEEYTKLLVDKKIEKHPKAVDVTSRAIF